jgi:hypothetical protein
MIESFSPREKFFKPNHNPFARRPKFSATILPTHADPIAELRRLVASLPRSPFRGKLSKMLKRKLPASSRPLAPSPAQQIPFSKASIPQLPGDVSNAASAGMTQHRPIQPLPTGP